jgi:phosphatidylserine/phosphatidylglycerophosphate/cardiolipin synthase-like enzyme
MTHLRCSLLVLGLSLPMLGCVAPTSETSADEPGSAEELRACGAFSTRTRAIQVSVTPEAAEAPIVDVLRTARHSIRVMVYMLEAGDVLDTLVEKASAADPKIAVKVILDRSKQASNQAAFDRLTAAGAYVHWSDPRFAFMHAKIAVVDESDAVISTGNFGAEMLSAERNYVAHDSDTRDVQSLVTLFDADWMQHTPALSCTRLLVSQINAKDRLLELIGRATSTLVVESMQLADLDIRDALRAQHDLGVNVRVLLADPAWIPANTSAARFLTDSHIPVRYLTAPKAHVKSIIVDGALAYLGSENLSLNSLSNNREVGIILAAQPAALDTMHRTFEADWAVGTGFPSAAHHSLVADPISDDGTAPLPY